jgi:hypothetical protein
MQAERSPRSPSLAEFRKRDETSSTLVVRRDPPTSNQPLSGQALLRTESNTHAKGLSSEIDNCS